MKIVGNRSSATSEKYREWDVAGRDITPNPTIYPECPTCGCPYILRLSFLIAGGTEWVWQRDCKHRVEPTVVSRALAGDYRRD